MADSKVARKPSHVSENTLYLSNIITSFKLPHAHTHSQTLLEQVLITLTVVSLRFYYKFKSD